MSVDGPDEIEAFYERHPYPPAVSELAMDQAASADGWEAACGAPPFVAGTAAGRLTRFRCRPEMG